ncbi:acyltransferase [Prevotella sp. PMUR]|uniref:Acyltransferase n=2 Tax=Xylanibacter muris TaxID=2736290 RepID=A0ABX2ARD0_9BACT|nr:acyltransferase [Xylanibacter muris]
MCMHLSTLFTKIKFWTNNVSFGRNLESSGIPFVHLSLHASCDIGCNFTIGNWAVLNASGIKGKSKIEVRNNAHLKIGDNVGMTATTIMCFNKILIGDNVKLGVGVHIYDTDFHNIDPMKRLAGDNIQTVKTKPVVIGNNVFIGAYSIILKGVTIGENSVIGAGAVVTKSIPANEIWAGNPAKCVKILK